MQLFINAVFIVFKNDLALFLYGIIHLLYIPKELLVFVFIPFVHHANIFDAGFEIFAGELAQLFDEVL